MFDSSARESSEWLALYLSLSYACLLPHTVLSEVLKQTRSLYVLHLVREILCEAKCFPVCTLKGRQLGSNASNLAIVFDFLLAWPHQQEKPALDLMSLSLKRSQITFSFMAFESGVV